MHSSRLRTARSLTVSRSIGGGGGLGVFCPTHPDADPPGCRPPSGCRPPPRCRPPSWMQSHLPDADPLDADPPVDRQTPVKTLPCPKLRFRAVKKGLILLTEHGNLLLPLHRQQVLSMYLYAKGEVSNSNNSEVIALTDRCINIQRERQD